MKSSNPSERYRKTGLPPGTLIYTGTQKADIIIKEFVRYNADVVEELNLETHTVLEAGYNYWLDVRESIIRLKLMNWEKDFILIRSYWKMF
jgi:hypothetical protein